MGHNVQMRELAGIRRRWEEAGSPPCEHTDRAREYHLGSHTGDTACLNCGKSFSPAQEAALLAKGK
ncbi:hypothetical protein [Lentzea nigeriaca]|uniref:hypothetical protein n=1 Tax=Lentzea nigeriaca TaxID=1128665 RepID=UPI001956DBB5|nr:hypothetical protein [Lentzea nigeriaca]MBM7861793.1 hypothetical protein [Lentzea nigeriaca]